MGALSRLAACTLPCSCSLQSAALYPSFWLTESLGISVGAQALEEDEQIKSDEYSDVMSKQMGSVLSYRHENGINFADILDDLMVGSCLQTPEDVDR